jgi:hypothetical protein
MWDKDGNYIQSKKEIDSEKAKKLAKDKNRDFRILLEEFLKKYEISGTANTYGFSVNKSVSIFSINRVEDAKKKLDELNIKYKLDYSNTWNVMFKIAKSEIFNFNENIKLIKPALPKIIDSKIKKAHTNTIRHEKDNITLKDAKIEIKALKLFADFDDEAKERIVFLKNKFKL